MPAKIPNIQNILALLRAENLHANFRSFSTSDSRGKIWIFEEEVDSIIRVIHYNNNLQHIL